MSNGNLLNSLLAINGANASTGKSTSPQKAKEASDGFQKALDQVRPEVAARQDERRITPPKARVEPQRPAVKPVERRDLPASASPVASQHARAKVETTEPRALDKTARATADKTQSNTPGAVSSAGSEPPVEASELDKIADTEAQLQSADSLVTQVLTDSAALPVVMAPPAGEVGEVDMTLPLTGEVDIDGQFPVVADSAGGSVLSGSRSDNLLLDTMVDSKDLLLAGAAPEGAVTDTAAVDGQTESIPLIPALTTVAAGIGAEFDAPLASGALQQGQLQTHQLHSGLTQATAPGPALRVADANSLDAVLLDELALAPVITAESGVGEPLALELGEQALLDNPDFLLLNSKAALNKLSEAALISLDKAVPAADSAKSLLAATSPALEALSRATESQSPAARAFVVQTGVPVTVGQPQWGQAVGEKVLWLAAQNVSAAEIRLDPPELGPMQVRVSVNQEQASVTFTSPHPMVREVLDQQLNRLREMFAEQGLNLANVDVSDKSFAQQDQEKRESGQASKTLEVDEDELLPVALSTMSTRLVDHYA